MLIYTYDGSFEGILTAVYEAYYRHEGPYAIVPSFNLQQSFLHSYIPISSDIVKAGKVYDAIKSKISPEALQNIYYVHLSEESQAPTLIYRFLRLGFRMGKNVSSFLTDDNVLQVNKISSRVAFEVHRLLGLLRFKEVTSGLFYAPVEPDNNIVALLAEHFTTRLSDQRWIIHDVKRSLCAVYDGEKWFLTEADVSPYQQEEQNEKHYQSLWLRYFKSIAIKGRINPRLQRQFMPGRYHKYLTEKQLEISTPANIL